MYKDKNTKNTCMQNLLRAIFSKNPFNVQIKQRPTHQEISDEPRHFKLELRCDNILGDEEIQKLLVLSSEIYASTIKIDNKKTIMSPFQTKSIKIVN